MAFGGPARVGAAGFRHGGRGVGPVCGTFSLPPTQDPFLKDTCFAGGGCAGTRFAGAAPGRVSACPKPIGYT